MIKHTDKYLTLTTKYGKAVIELYSNKAPNHVQRIQELANEHFYDGLKFHRVIDNFMVQTGCPQGNGMGGSNKGNIKAEFNNIHHGVGIVSMARSQHPDSANSQFFIVIGDAPWLDGQYTAFGKVIHGMNFIHNIKKGAHGSGTVNNPDSIISLSCGMPDDIATELLHGDLPH